MTIWTRANLYRTVLDKVQSANVYLGAQPLVEALDKGAQIIVGGRLTDTGLTLAPLMHEFGWTFDDWDKVATGTIAGHIIECGGQCSGGNCQFDWEAIPDLANIGFPIVEAYPSGEFVITKHENTGGRINIQSIKEQLLYEMGDPKSYITPDVVADFTTIQSQRRRRKSRSKFTASKAIRTQIFTKFRLLIRAVGKPSERSFTLIRTLTKKPKPPIKFCGRGLIN